MRAVPWKLSTKAMMIISPWLKGSRLAVLMSSRPQVAMNSRRLPLTQTKPTIQKRANRMSLLDAIKTPATIAVINKQLMKQLVIKSRLKAMKKLRPVEERKKKSNPLKWSTPSSRRARRLASQPVA